MKEVTLNEIQNDFPGYLKLAEDEEIVIMQDGKPAGMLINFNSSEDWFDYWLEGDPRFLRRIQSARENIRAGRSVKLEDVEL